jgi:hypothetical protein
MVEGNLPDMPVRWALYHPSDDGTALLATEIGVWATTDLNAADDVTWTPDVEGMANVRVDMLQLRENDRTVLAATHGRGFFTTSWLPYLGVDDDNDVKNIALEVYPNPTNGIINQKTENKNARLKIFDISGKVVFEDILAASQQRVDISSLPKGNYILKVISANREESKKIVLK